MARPLPTADSPLTSRQRILVAVYLQTWNIAAASRAAKYAHEPAGLKSFYLPNVQAAIKKAITEAGLDPDTVKARISQQAQVNSAEFMIFEDRPVLDKNGKPLLSSDGKPITKREYVGVDWAEVERRGYLVKGIKYSRQGVPMLEMYDSQHALDSMARIHRLFVDENDKGQSFEEKPVMLPADVIATPFLDVYRDSRDRKHMEYLLKGGRGSTKSSFASLDIVYLLVNNPGVHALAMRQVANTLRDSVYSQIVWAIEILGLADRFKCITSPLEIEYVPTGQKIYFRGADKPEMVKSIKPVFGHIGILWFEELDQFHGPEAIRKIEQSVLRGGAEAWEFKTYNPPRTAANWVNKYVQIPKANQFQHHSTYLDVPAEWLGQTFIDEAEHLKAVNPTAYQHEYLGEVVGTGGTVFENIKIRTITDEEIAEFDHILQGIDWGYYPDPWAWGKMHYDAARHVLYIFDELRMQKAGNKETYTELVTKKGVTPDDLIIADSAEPKSVADYRQYSSEGIPAVDANGVPILDNRGKPVLLFGPACRAAEKGPESVKYSMKWLQSLAAIVIDNQRCPNHAEEFLNYELEQDKDGNFISEYPDRDNHFIDETRYATNLIWRRRGQ